MAIDTTVWALDGCPIMSSCNWKYFACRRINLQVVGAPQQSGNEHGRPMALLTTSGTPLRGTEKEMTLVFPLQGLMLASGSPSSR